MSEPTGALSSPPQERAQPAAPRRATGGDIVRACLRGVGQTLMTAGVIMLLYVVWSLYITNVFTARDQVKLNDNLAMTWARTPTATPRMTPLGDAFARIYVPRLGIGMDKKLAVLQGVGVEDLKKGPGHIPTTADPGGIGNTVISGHRTTHGAPFSRLDELKVGDEIILETARSWFTYRMTSREIVLPSDYAVTYPVPNDPKATPRTAMVTLTTCNPKYSATERMIIHGLLFTTVPKTGGARPPALAGV